ncbi:CUE domain-containing protein [Bacillaceae bacterium IKA-2]|nr:CUE domain-containing protein [Bacillaceae bacterium IKA-2]
MKKKLIAVITAAALVLGIGTVAMANSDSEVFENVNFKEMIPFMQEMHPDFDEAELEEMYESCHGQGGMMSGRSGGFMHGMMKGNSEGFKNMMNGQNGNKF